MVSLSLLYRQGEFAAIFLTKNKKSDTSSGGFFLLDILVASAIILFLAATLGAALQMMVLASRSSKDAFMAAQLCQEKLAQLQAVGTASILDSSQEDLLCNQVRFRREVHIKPHPRYQELAVVTVYVHWQEGRNEEQVYYCTYVPSQKVMAIQ
ncbi:MAG: hypothetical protein E6713_12665 [Sporomusaceae bacterium]|nr:hypothetical protein [Sporomusaceae bacterium]